MPSPDSEKSTLRQNLRNRRRAMRAADIRRDSESACRRLQSQLRHARDVGLYLADEGEPDPMPLARWLWQRGIRVFVPCLTGNRHLAWRRLRRGTPLRRNVLGIREPAFGERTRHPDVVVLPLVAFDTRGGRLGRGGGHYDRTLAGTRGLRRFGLAWDWQRVAHVPVEPHDLRLHGVATSRRWHVCRHPS